MGLAPKSGLDGLSVWGGKRSSSLKSIEFSVGGFHLSLCLKVRVKVNLMHGDVQALQSLSLRSYIRSSVPVT